MNVPAISLLLAGWLSQAPAAPPVRVLSETGERRAGLPVAAEHLDPGPYLRVLTRGYTARLVRLYQLEQRFVRPGTTAQPAILVITSTQGGFPRWGLYLDAPQRDLAYVDLHRRSRPSGRYGAIDQIFPHELLHIIVRDLAGAPPRGRATQVHAVGVTTDRATAFNEGFAEHAQVMAIDDPGAVPETRALASGSDARFAFDRFQHYSDALGARLEIASRPRITFPFWFSGTEQVLRYHAVKANLFAYEADVPRHLYSRRGAYSAYLLENTRPGWPRSGRKPLPRLLATEGVVSAFFHRLVTDRRIQAGYRDPAFYERFGIGAAEVDPLDNAYLKVFAAIRQGGHDTGAVAAAYGRLFPEDGAALDSIVDEIFGQPIRQVPEVWLLNQFTTVGTSLFDQYRGSPRPPAFDLNAASRADLVAVPGVDLPLAEKIIRGMPYASVENLGRVRGLAPETLARFRAMSAAMDAPPPAGTAAEGSLTFRTILMPYLWRALVVWAACAAAGAMLYRAVRTAAWWRVCLNGLAAAAVALLTGWMTDPPMTWLAAASPAVVFGLPAAFIHAFRTRSPRGCALVLAAWATAAIPAWVALTPIP